MTTEKSGEDLVPIALRYRRDGDDRLFVVHMLVKRSEIGTEKIHVYEITSWGAFDNYEHITHVDTQVDRPVILSTYETLRRYIERKLHPEIPSAA